MVDGFARNIKHTSEGIIGGRKMENMKSVIRLRMSAHDRSEEHTSELQSH